MNVLFVSPVENTLLLWTLRTQGDFETSLGMSQCDFFSWRSLCFPLCPPLSHLALWALLMSLEVFYHCAFALTPPLKPAVSSETLHFVSLSSFVFLPLLFLFSFTFFPSFLLADSLEARARYSCVWQWTHVTVPCHTKHSPMPVNDTKRHPTMHITMVARLSAGFISGKKSVWQRSQCRVQWRWHQWLWLRLFRQPLPPTLCRYHRFSQSVARESEREKEDWEIWEISWLYL